MLSAFFVKVVYQRQAFLVRVICFPESKHSRQFIYEKTSIGKLKIQMENKFDFWVLNAFKTAYFDA